MFDNVHLQNKFYFHNYFYLMNHLFLMKEALVIHFYLNQTYLKI